jgi:hypothetical protein
MMELKIEDSRSLQEASAYLHDAVFDRAGVGFDQTTKRVSISLWRELWEETTSERFLLFLHRWKAPHARCVLEFEHVTNSEVIATDKLDQDQIVSMAFDSDKGEVAIVGACCLTIRIKVETLRGCVRDVGERTTQSFNKMTIGFRPVR